ncbi:MAG: class 1 fructose-bisphosphatase [Candidatus Lloydbacteria bacterium]|nr:class 1 fructose-bisphosphatase [Candidatus Lloydbacteria bacterium]
MNDSQIGLTLIQHIRLEQMAHRTATGKLSGLLNEIMIAAKIISYEVNTAGVNHKKLLGKDGTVNTHGEDRQKLDVYSNNTFIHILERSGYLAIMGSEENDSPIYIPEKYKPGKYVLLMDPLDGSSNIDVGVSIGTIFSIYERVSHSGSGTLEDLLQPGNKQVAAGYILYGSSTIFVYTTRGGGVHDFTLDTNTGEFLLSHSNIVIPKKGTIYSINEGNSNSWSRGQRKYINYLKASDSNTGRPYSSRYVGSFVSDFHRTLLKGGIFMYPSDHKSPNGKLRLGYECNPMAFIVEKAGGKASTGSGRILDIVPTELHQRTPLYIGSPEDVEMAEKYLAEEVKIR